MRELRACARHGHVTYRPDEADLRERLRADSAVGELWRCLRCGDFVGGPPTGAGPADEAPVPPRGKALRQLAILRLLAVERVLRGLVLVGGAYAILRFRSSQATLRRLFAQDLPAARPLADRFGLDLDHSSLVNLAHRALTTKLSTLTVLAAVVAAYGALELVEGAGLWLVQRWAEYLTVVATAAFLPLEIHEIATRTTLVRVGALVLNVAAIVYLLIAKRLFGLRGGREAYERELRGEALLEVEAAALAPAPDPPDGAHRAGPLSV
ncbi:MAG TPA: DUF2127 domain-containing protein [Acidimicrobiales bacterium]|nr:DUF2127 domain-containing protein [Acidimicrobiales bacterium]